MQGYDEYSLMNELLNINFDEYLQQDNEVLKVLNDNQLIYRFIRSLSGPYSENLYRLIIVYCSNTNKHLNKNIDRNNITFFTQDPEIIELCLRYMLFIRKHFCN